jgi:hypothetical protein
MDATTVRSALAAIVFRVSDENERAAIYAECHSISLCKMNNMDFDGDEC